MHENVNENNRKTRMFTQPAEDVAGSPTKQRKKPSRPNSNLPLSVQPIPKIVTFLRCNVSHITAKSNDLK